MLVWEGEVYNSLLSCSRSPGSIELPRLQRGRRGRGEGIEISERETREERTARRQDCFMKTKPGATSGAERKTEFSLKYAQTDLLHQNASRMHTGQMRLVV